MNAPENPAEVMRRAAALMRKRAEDATPGPWERPLDTRTKSAVIAALPDDEEGSYRSGMIPAEFASHKGPTGRYAGQRERVGVVSASTWSGGGGFARKRSGRDLEHIASWDPVVALAVAEWLEWTGERAADEIYRDEVECADPDSCDGQHGEEWFCNRCAEVVGDNCSCWNRAIDVAFAYLGEPS